MVHSWQVTEIGPDLVILVPTQWFRQTVEGLMWLLTLLLSQSLTKVVLPVLGPAAHTEILLSELRWSLLICGLEPLSIATQS